MNTVPYTNARREGRTSPGMVEMIAPDDSRRTGPRYVPNRADRRRDGHRLPVTDTLPIQRRNPVSRNRRRHPEAVSA